MSARDCDGVIKRLRDELEAARRECATWKEAQRHTLESVEILSRRLMAVTSATWILHASAAAAARDGRLTAVEREALPATIEALRLHGYNSGEAPAGKETP